MNANSRVGTMNIDQFELREMPGFTEYLRSGWGVNTSFAIDFTASNGELFEAGSLHEQDQTGRTKNQYEQAILGVGSIIEPYALD